MLCLMFVICFRRAHTLTVLFVLVSVLVYVAVFEPVRDDTSYNTKRYRPMFSMFDALGH
jgi:hypothetical protein